MKSKLYEKLDAFGTSIDPIDETKEHVRDMLICARDATNGHPEKIQAISETVGHMALILARIELRETQCPFKGQIGGRLATLYPFRWPLAVVLSVVLSVAAAVLGGDRVYKLITEYKAQMAQYVPEG